MDIGPSVFTLVVAFLAALPGLLALRSEKRRADAEMVKADGSHDVALSQAASQMIDTLRKELTITQAELGKLRVEFSDLHSEYSDQIRESKELREEFARLEESHKLALWENVKMRARLAALERQIEGLGHKPSPWGED